MSWALNLINDKKSKRKLFPNVKNRRLLELGVLRFAFFADHSQEPALTLIRRLWAQGCYNTNNSNIASVIEPNDVIAILGCSQSNAKEYVTMLRVISQ